MQRDVAKNASPKTIITVCNLYKLVIAVGISTHICNGSLVQYVLVIILNLQS